MLKLPRVYILLCFMVPEKTSLSLGGDKPSLSLSQSLFIPSIRFRDEMVLERSIRLSGQVLRAVVWF